MIFDLLRGNIVDALIMFMLYVPIVLMAITFHEYAHGYVAYKLGDPTARNLGRLSLNPMKHLDLFGALSFLILGIGWANPVPINTRYFKKPKKGMAIVALAGPAMNLILGVTAISIYCLCFKFIPSVAQNPVLELFFTQLAFLNFYFAFFNLLPIPPFDGSRIAFVILPDRLYFKVMRHERVIMLVTLIAIILLTRYGWNPFYNLSEYLLYGIVRLYNLILF